MLIQFSVENFKSFNKKFTFDLSGPRDYEFNQHLIKDNCVKDALIYGYNGTGKSNLGFAMMDILANLTDKQIHEREYQNYTNANSEKKFACFEYTFRFKGKDLCYQYQKQSDKKLLSEKLKLGDQILLNYNREENPKKVENHIEGTENLEIDLQQIDIPILRYVRRNSSPSGETGEILQDLFRFVDRLLHFRNLDDRFYQGFQIGRTNIGSDIIQRGNLQNLKEFLGAAKLDLDLEKIEILNRDKDAGDTIGIRFKNETLPFFEVISTGTRSLTLFYFWYQHCIQDQKTGAHPSLIFIDEFDAFYHTEASSLVFRKLCELKDVQVVLTTHNLDLFTNKMSRPDCLYLMNNHSIAPIYQLTERSELREVHNLAKLYKGGAFEDALTKLGQR